MSGRRFLKSVLLSLVLGPWSLAFAQQPQHPVLDAPGFREHRDYFSEMPFENIDTLTGSLVLRFTDLALPANAGRELRFERTYNSKTRAWTFGVAGVNAKFLDRGIKDGAVFKSVTPRNQIRSDSALEREVNYLLERGYKWNKSGTELIRF